MSTPSDPIAPKRRRPGEGKIFRARLTLFWEKLWPALLPALVVPYLILIFALVGGAGWVPFWVRIATLVCASLLFGSLLYRRLRGVGFPSRQAGQARLERDGGVTHAALRALDDTPVQSGDPSDADRSNAGALWAAHLEASERRAAAARLHRARATGDQSDPWGLRWLALGVGAVAFIIAGPDWRSRLTVFASPGAHSLMVADAWIEPPDYTPKAPVYLLRAGEDIIDDDVRAQINIPEGSKLVVQSHGRRTPVLRYSTGDRVLDAQVERNGAAARASIQLDESGVARLGFRGREITWPIGVIVDEKPTVAFVTLPAGDDKALFAFQYTVYDDYSINDVALRLRLDPNQERPVDAPPLDDQALTQERHIEIAGAGGASGERSESLDLQSDPWAGLHVLARLSVTDGAGQIGLSEEVSVRLPARLFFNPLAKTVIEQRQTLAVAAEKWPRAARSLDAVTFAPEVFYDDASDFLMLRTAYWRVMRQDGEGFADAVEKFWPLALTLEDEALELARQRLQAAEEALRKALENNASDSEIERLVEDLRQAMNDFITALAQSGGPLPPAGGGNGSQQLGQSDLDEMLDSIQDLSQSGANNAARQLLSDLENILENMRLAQGSGDEGQEGSPGQGAQGQGGPGQPGAGQSSGPGQAGGDQSGASRAGDLIERQRALSDETFSRGQSPGQTSSDDLASEEQAIGSDLDTLIDELQGDGQSDGARRLGSARNDIRQAETALRNGDHEAAGSAMERAIEDLRAGAEELAKSEREQGEGGSGEGVAQFDPLGRRVGNGEGGGVEVPPKSDADRSRTIIDNIRRRLGEPGRDEDEVDYLERLLDDF